ncbi:MAG TPA: sigma 54-interacting transcriptional regulator [Clostridiales bacterium]|jgi:PAS domain S-box-containing protein|nr:sigma 54-interacting transcriptional regulator [Clostridiales bacterium]
MSATEKFIKKISSLFGLETDVITEETFAVLLDKIEKMKQENDMLNLTLDNSADNFHVTDGKGKILRVNRAFEKHCQVNREFVEGKTVRDMERLGIYKPSMTPVAIKEKRQITFLQNVPGDKVITTITPILNKEGDVHLVVSNARLIDELKLLDKYYNAKSHNKSKAIQSEIISKSLAMQTVKDFANWVAKSDSSVMITGETGSGKSMLAKYIHDHSLRHNAKFVEINCAAIPDNLIESELFGYSAGAFTGAKEGGKRGLIEIANKGTLFLDEIGDMPLNIQAKLLNVLQNRQITRVGGEEAIPVDIRLITATNFDLPAMIAEGRFRSELYYRINVVPIYIPPLRERKEDILPLIEHFRSKYSKIHKTNVVISLNAMDAMAGYSWPGNIRELENFIERLIVTDQKGFIEVTDLPNYLQTIIDGVPGRTITIKETLPLKEAIEEVERQMVVSAYESCGSSYKTAELLQISQSAAMRKIHKYIRSKK